MKKIFFDSKSSQSAEVLSSDIASELTVFEDEFLLLDELAKESGPLLILTQNNPPENLAKVISTLESVQGHLCYLVIPTEAHILRNLKIEGYVPDLVLQTPFNFNLLKATLALWEGPSMSMPTSQIDEGFELGDDDLLADVDLSGEVLVEEPLNAPIEEITNNETSEFSLGDDDLLSGEDLAEFADEPEEMSVADDLSIASETPESEIPEMDELAITDDDLSLGDEGLEVSDVEGDLSLAGNDLGLGEDDLEITDEDLSLGDDLSVDELSVDELSLDENLADEGELSLSEELEPEVGELSLSDDNLSLGDDSLNLESEVPQDVASEQSGLSLSLDSAADLELSLNNETANDELEIAEQSSDDLSVGPSEADLDLNIDNEILDHHLENETNDKPVTPADDYTVTATKNKTPEPSIEFSISKDDEEGIDLDDGMSIEDEFENHLEFASKTGMARMSEDGQVERLTALTELNSDQESESDQDDYLQKLAEIDEMMESEVHEEPEFEANTSLNDLSPNLSEETSVIPNTTPIASAPIDEDMLKKYIPEIKSELVQDLEDRIESLQQKIIELESTAEGDREKYWEQKYKEVELKLRVKEESFQDQLTKWSRVSLEFEEKLQVQKEMIDTLNIEIKELSTGQRIEEQKGKNKERELKSQLELLKMDSVAQLKSREEKIGELTRKIDLYAYEMKALQQKNHQLEMKYQHSEEKQKRIIGALRESLSQIDSSPISKLINDVRKTMEG